MTGASRSWAARPGQGRRAPARRREAGSGGADFVATVAQRSAVEDAAKLGVPLILEAAGRATTRWALNERYSWVSCGALPRGMGPRALSFGSRDGGSQSAEIESLDELRAALGETPQAFETTQRTLETMVDCDVERLHCGSPAGERKEDTKRATHGAALGDQRNSTSSAMISQP